MVETYHNEGAELISAIAIEKKRLQSLLGHINSDRIHEAGYGALAASVILNFVCLADSPGDYMVLWILSSLYFYLTYPLLPLVFILLPNLFRKKETKTRRDPLLPWLRNLHLIRNRRIVLQLAIRFFILGIMPLTSGMVLIYSLSLVYGVFLGASGGLPLLTSLLIVVQCLGILIFYLDLSFLKRQFSFLIKSLALATPDHWVRYLLVGIFGIVVVVIASVSAVILLIAILLPGFTLGVYVDAAGLVQNRSNVRILLLLICQFIIMQYFQSLLSRRIASNICTEQLSRLEQAEDVLNKAIPETGKSECLPVSQDALSAILPLVIESRIHGIVRMQMIGLFPTYTISVNINEILRIQSLEDLSGMFREQQ